MQKYSIFWLYQKQYKTVYHGSITRNFAVFWPWQWQSKTSTLCRPSSTQIHEHQALPLPYFVAQKVVGSYPFRGRQDGWKSGGIFTWMCWTWYSLSPMGQNSKYNLSVDKLLSNNQPKIHFVHWWRGQFKVGCTAHRRSTWFWTGSLDLPFNLEHST